LTKKASEVVLANALKGGHPVESYARIQQKLLLLYQARQQIEQVITTLLIYQVT